MHINDGHFGRALTLDPPPAPTSINNIPAPLLIIDDSIRNSLDRMSSPRHMQKILTAREKGLIEYPVQQVSEIGRGNSSKVYKSVMLPSLELVAEMFGGASESRQLFSELKVLQGVLSYINLY